MKNLTTFATGFLLLFCLAAPAAHADYFGVNISDANQYSDGNTFFQLFNRYFEQQLDGNLFENSNQVFSAYGVDPNTSWTTQGSQLVGAFKVAAFSHELAMVDRQTGESVATITNVGGTQNISSPTGITDLSGQQVVNIADGLNVDFTLHAYMGAYDYLWSSDPTKNQDGMIHMIALDITDLYNEKYGTENDSVYMFGWEDMMFGAGADGDYQDFVVIMTNLTATSTTTPEPASLLIFGVGLAALPVVRKMRRRSKKM